MVSTEHSVYLALLSFNYEHSERQILRTECSPRPLLHVLDSHAGL